MQGVIVTKACNLQNGGWLTNVWQVDSTWMAGALQVHGKYAMLLNSLQQDAQHWACLSQKPL